ncbi:AsmA family protein [Lysobacter niabensis]|uniref:AsmA family protein n=1 Tax=Agrilutibacter niabensis TaxID=380628 RepID=UPI00361D3FD1
MPTPDRRQLLTTHARTLRRHPWLTLTGVFLVALIVLVCIWDWNWFKGPIERQVQARTGRAFDIGGNLDVDLDWTAPTIRADSLRFGNAKWSKQPVMASADRAEFSVRIWPLLRGHVRIPELKLQRPVLHLEMGPQRVGNWNFGKGGDTRMQFSHLWIDGGNLSFIDAANRTDVDVAVNSRSDRAKGSSVAVEGGGRWKGSRFQMKGVGESPLELRNRNRPYRIDVHASAGATRAHARGSLVDPVLLRDFDLQLALSGQDLADLYPLLGIVAPNTPPYRLDGRFTREITGTDARIWHYDNFHGMVGDSDLNGDASIETGRARPYLRANLSSKVLDFDDLAGFVNKAPQSGNGESTNAELAAQASSERARTKVLPDRPYELDKLRAMDADVRYKAHRISAPKWPLDDMDTHLRLDNGLLQLEPLNFGVAGGQVRAVVRMDARGNPIRTRAQIKARGLNLRELVPDVKLAQDAIGRIGGDVALAGSGNSIALMLGSSEGDVAVGMGRGQISNLLMELAGIDIAEALKFLVRGDRRIPIRCAFGDFGVSNGVMTSRSMAFDTEDTIIIGEGTVSLREETLHLKLRPRPKDRSLIALRAPLWIDGTFKDPDIHPDYGRIGLRGALALVLGNIAPPAALLATLELGPGEDAQCGGRYAK